MMMYWLSRKPRTSFVHMLVPNILSMFIGDCNTKDATDQEEEGNANDTFVSSVEAWKIQRLDVKPKLFIKEK